MSRLNIVILVVSIIGGISLSAADHDLYRYSVSATGGFSINSSDTHLDNGLNLGLRYTQNVPTSYPWEVGAYQFSFDYSGDTDYNNGAGETSISRFGVNLLWFMDNQSEITPFLLAGTGLEFFSNEADNDDGLFGTIGGGVEYQIKGDLSFLAEGKWIYAGDNDSYFLTNFGIKYSFGQ